MKTTNIKIAAITFMIGLFLCLTALDLANGVKVDWWGHLVTSVFAAGGFMLLKKLEYIHNKRKP